MVIYSKEQHLFTLKDLSQAVDVYSDWLDECEKANQGGASSAPATTATRTSSTTSVSQSQSFADDDEDPDDE
jgi:transcription elongation factor Elf1